MKNKLSKILAMGIIVLFMGVSVVSSADSVNCNVKEELKDYLKSKSPNIDALIFARLDGATSYGISYDGIFIKRNFEAEALHQASLNIDGYIIPTMENGNRFVLRESLQYIKVSIFIGKVQTPIPHEDTIIDGFCFGEIEWIIE